MTLWRIRARLADRPGRLASLANGLAGLSANILALQVYVASDGVVDDLVVETPITVGQDALRTSTEEHCTGTAVVTPADMRDLADSGSRALHIARGLVDGRTDVARALTTLLGAQHVRWAKADRDAGGDADGRQGGVHGNTMVVDAPGGRQLVITRTTVPFTDTEYARACALLDVYWAMVRRRPATAQTMVLEDGTALWLRPAGPDDVDHVIEMHQRCSPASHYGRYLGGVPRAPRIRTLVAPAAGHALVAQHPNGTIVGLATLLTEGVDSELGLLVEDAYQHHGVGTALAADLLRRAAQHGTEVVYIPRRPDAAAIDRLLTRLGYPHDDTTVDGLKLSTLHLLEPATTGTMEVA